MVNYKIGQCSKILNTSHLPNMSGQAVQTLIRLLLQKQPDQICTVCYSDKHFTKANILFENRKRKVFEILDHLPYLQLWGAQWLSGRVLDSRPKGCGFEPHRRHCVVVLEQDTFILA